MHRAELSSRRAVWVLWICVLAVLAKAAMPYLATASAERQGRSLVEVCTVYGVATVAVDGVRHGTPDSAAGHAAEHCALTALSAFAGADARMASLPVAAPAPTAAPPRAAPTSLDDACARWAARLRHGPPRTA